MSILEPISQDKPYGIDFRYEDEYLEIEVEIEKSFNVTSENETEWGFVISKCEKILTKDSKDLKIASFWLYSRWKKNGMADFLDSLEIFAQFVERYGKDLYPKAGKRKVKIIEWLENVFEEPLIENLEEFPENSLESLSKTLLKLQTDLPATIEKEHIFLKEVKLKSIEIAERDRKRREEETKQAEQLKGEEARRRAEEEALSEEQRIRRMEEEEILSRFSPSAAQNILKNSTLHEEYSSLSEDDTENAFELLKELVKELFQKAPADYLPFRLLFSVGETVMEDALCGNISDSDLLVPSEDIRRASRDLKELQSISIGQLNALEEQLILRPAWLEGYYIASRILYKLDRAKEAGKLETLIIYFLHRHEEVLEFSIGGRDLLDENMLSWARSKLLSLCDDGGGAVEYRRAYQEVLTVMKGQSSQNALDLLEEYYRKASGEEERFRWRLLFVEFALVIGDKQLALSLLLELERIIEEFKIDRWQPELAITTYETLLKPIMAHELGNSEKERIYNKLSILAIQKVIKL